MDLDLAAGEPVYLSLNPITSVQAQEFIDFASSLIGEEIHIIRSKLANCSPFPLDYLQLDEDANCFTPDKIADLIQRVCKIKCIPLPRQTKVVLAEVSFDYLYAQFQEKHLYTGDFLAMIDLSLA